MSPHAAHAHHHARRWAILGVLGLAQLMVVLDATIVNVALPTIQSKLHFSVSDRQWIVTAYSLAFGSLLLFGGRLSDLLGRKRTLLIGLAGFAVASAIGGEAQNFTMLLIARAIQGLFGAVLAPAALAMLTTTFTDPKERAKAFSIYGAIAGSGAAIGLLLGGFLTQFFSWRWTLLVNLIFAAAGIIGTLTLMVQVKSENHDSLDLTSTALVSAGLLGVVYSLSNAATVATNDAMSHHVPTLAHAFTNIPTLWTMGVGLVLLGIFVRRQYTMKRPMLPIHVVADRTRGGSFLAIFLSAVGLFAVFLFLTYFLQGLLGFSPVMTGFAFLPMPAVISVTVVVASTRLLPRTGPRPLVTTGMVLAALGMFYFTHLSVHGTYVTHVLPGLIITAAGVGLVFAPSMNMATFGVDREHAGVASATVNVAQQVGGSIGTALLNTIAVSTTASLIASGAGSDLQARALVSGYDKSFWWATAIFAAGAVISYVTLPKGALDMSSPDEAPALVH